MKSWFPLTDYDFYAYLTSGGVALVVVDYIATGGQWIGRADWTFLQIVAVLAGSYIVGHLVASLSSAILEHGLARKLLAAPVAVQLGVKKSGPAGRAFGKVVVDKYYAPFATPLQERMWTAAATKLNISRHLLDDPETVFQIAYSAGRSQDDSRARMDAFRNQYGFCRNIGLVSLVSAAALSIQGYLRQDQAAYVMAILLAVVGLGMTQRFLKFYAAFSAEVLRSLLK